MFSPEGPLASSLATRSLLSSGSPIHRTTTLATQLLLQGHMDSGERGRGGGGTFPLSQSCLGHVSKVGGGELSMQPVCAAVLCGLVVLIK